MVKAKARLVARRFRQRPGVDCHAPFASTLATPCIRLTTTYDEAMRSPYHASWSYAMEGEVAGLEEAGTFDTKQQEGGNVVSAKRYTHGDQMRTVGW